MSNLTNEQLQFVKQVRDRLIELYNEKVISDRIVAQSTGYSKTTVNQFKNDKYPTEESLPDIASKINSFIENFEASSDGNISKGHLKFAMTAGAEKIFKTASFALSENKISVVTGIPGCGKTHAVKEFQRRKPNTILIEVNPLVTRRSIIADICSSLKIPTYHYRSTRHVPISSDELFKSIVNSLKNSNRLLMVDEGEHLTVSCLEVIRRIQDFTEIGMLLCGTDKLLDRLKGPRHELQQLFSRVGYQEVIHKLELSDIKAILNLNYPEAIKFAPTFLSLSKNNGRYLEHLITLVKKTIRESGETLSEDLIDEAAGSLLT